MKAWPVSMKYLLEKKNISKFVILNLLSSPKGKRQIVLILLLFRKFID